MRSARSWPSDERRRPATISRLLLNLLVSSRDFLPARRPRTGEFFGYIVQDDGSEDLYVHAKALSAVPGGVLQAGDKVEYRVAVFNERPRAKDVRVLKRA